MRNFACRMSHVVCRYDVKIITQYCGQRVEKYVGSQRTTDLVYALHPQRHQTTEKRRVHNTHSCTHKLHVLHTLCVQFHICYSQLLHTFPIAYNYYYIYK